ncbi:MAG: TMEM175 family protein [Vulcanimicrobiaceae bacterium]
MSDAPVRAPNGAHDERLMHRLEAFSDIVLGFSLAQLGLNLTLPQHNVSQIFYKPYGLIAFACTFLFVSIIWYQHHRIFVNYFKPRPLTIVLNFAMLGCTVMLVYALQVFVKFLNTDQRDAATMFYLVAFSIVYACLGALYATGVRDRWGELDAALRTRGIRSAMRLVGVGVITILGMFVSSAVGWPLMYAPCFVVPVLLAVRIAWRAQDARARAARA